MDLGILDLLRHLWVDLPVRPPWYVEVSLVVLGVAPWFSWQTKPPPFQLLHPPEFDPFAFFPECIVILLFSVKGHG